jgi:glycosyltransferase involved in cell wall biosynthesis
VAGDEVSLRIGLVTSEFPPDLGGVETYAWQLARELGQRQELQVTVYAPHKSADITPPLGVTIKPWVTSCMGLDWAKLKNEPIDVWHALSAAHAWLAMKGKPTVVSVHGNDFLAPYPLTMQLALDLPVFWRWRGFAWGNFQPFWRGATCRMLAHALPRAATIIANSHYTAEILRKKYPACAEKLKVAWVGVDAGFFDVVRASVVGPPKLLTVCRLSEPRKNVDLVLRALAGLKDQFNFEYVVAGEGHLRAELKGLAETLGLSSRVRFTGRVSDAELRQLYAEASLFVLPASIVPSSHEGFGIVYLEAAASGVPSLAARLAGAAEAVGDGQSGYFVAEPDVPSIQTALRDFLSGNIRFDAEGCRTFARQFTWARVADVAIESYRLAFSPHPAKP